MKKSCAEGAMKRGYVFALATAFALLTGTAGGQPVEQVLSLAKKEKARLCSTH